MRCATWNVNGMRARLEFFLHWLRNRRPDVVGLQELKLTDEQFPHDALAAEGYRAVTHGQKGWNGVAIVSREECRVRQRGLPGQEQRGARLLTAELGPLSFTTLYCPNGKSVSHDDFPLKLQWFDALAEHLSGQIDSQRPSIVCGDFNICPGPLDSWNEDGLRGSIFHTDQERERFRGLLEPGLSDLYREVSPAGREYSWWDYRGGAFHRGQGLRIDLLLATAPVVRRVREVWVDRDYRKKQDGMTASDHAPVIVDLEPA